jgi:hypothetical protein
MSEPVNLSKRIKGWAFPDLALLDVTHFGSAPTIAGLTKGKTITFDGDYAGTLEKAIAEYERSLPSVGDQCTISFGGSEYAVTVTKRFKNAGDETEFRFTVRESGRP